MKKSNKKERAEKYIPLLALQNIFVAIIAKILIIYWGAYGAPLIVTVILWIFMINSQKWSFIAFKILVFIEAAVGLYAIIAFIGYVCHGNNPFPCIVQIVLSTSYLFSGICLYKLK